MGLPELLDVLHDRQGQLALVGGSLDVAPCQALDVLAAEDRLPGADALQVGPQLFQLPGVEHPGAHGRLVAGLPVNVPAAEDQVIQRSQGDEVLDQGDPIFGALAQPDRSHLGEGPDRRSFLPANGFDSGNEGGRHGAHPGKKNSQLAPGFGNFGPFLNHGVLSDIKAGSNEPKSCNEVGMHGNSKIPARLRKGKRFPGYPAAWPWTMMLSGNCPPAF